MIAVGAAELSSPAALQLAKKLVYELPDVTEYRNIWPQAVPLLCEGVSACVALLRWMGSPTLSDPISSDCQVCSSQGTCSHALLQQHVYRRFTPVAAPQDTVGAFMDFIQGLVRGLPAFKEACGAPMIDVLVKSVCEAIARGSADRGILSVIADDACPAPATLCGSDPFMYLQERASQRLQGALSSVVNCCLRL